LGCRRRGKPPARAKRSRQTQPNKTFATPVTNLVDGYVDRICGLYGPKGAREAAPTVDEEIVCFLEELKELEFHIRGESRVLTSVRPGRYGVVGIEGLILYKVKAFMARAEFDLVSKIPRRMAYEKKIVHQYNS
jgi:hypothetical protein